MSDRAIGDFGKRERQAADTRNWPVGPITFNRQGARLGSFLVSLTPEGQLGQGKCEEKAQQQELGTVANPVEQVESHALT